MLEEDRVRLLGFQDFESLLKVEPVWYDYNSPAKLLEFGGHGGTP